MMSHKIFLIGTCLLLSSPVMAKTWANVNAPTQTLPRVIGKPNSGCIAGAQALPLQGEGYLVVHLERHRHYGHPSLIQALQTLAKQAQQQAINPLQIGDLGQARGGPLPFGHRSHQTGLDADIWFNLDPNSYANANAQRSNIHQPTMLTIDKPGLDKNRWTQQHTLVLKLTAQLPEVDRVFVNPYIKKELCDSAGEERDWLRKIRPWFYHDDHFHLRLHCPPDSPDCEKQAAIPAGDGCGAELISWFEKAPIVKHTPSPPHPVMPKACADVLSAP